MVSVAFEAAAVVSKSDLPQPLRLVLYFQLSLRKEQRAGCCVIVFVHRGADADALRYPR